MALPFTTNIQTPTKYPLAWIYTFFPSPRVVVKTVKTNFPLHGVELSIALVKLSTARLRDSAAPMRLSIARSTFPLHWRRMAQVDDQCKIATQALP
jgi:hypothetical protein